MNKYLNEAIIGNKNMLATFTEKGELQRLYFPCKDHKQYIDFFHTGVRINTSDLIYLHDDINNVYKQYYDTDTNVLNTEVVNTYFNLQMLQTECTSKKIFIYKRINNRPRHKILYTFRTTNRPKQYGRNKNSRRRNVTICT